MSIEKANILAIVIGLLAMTQLLGGVSGIIPLKGFGASLAMAPYPRVFSDVDGLETFASSFEIHTGKDNSWSSIKINPQVYSNLKGSYNRRNVYGAGLAYGPKLPEDLRRQIFYYGLKNPGTLLKELAIPEGECQIIEIRTKTKGRSEIWHLGATREEEKEYERFIKQ
jgi:hypothetical protein